MPSSDDEFSVYRQLREKAEAQLLTGTASAGRQWSLGVDALRLLHRLSSNPEDAEDALKLLHELQVHQVELDLQNEEIVASEQGLVGDLDRYRELFDAAPFAYFHVNRMGTIINSNFVAAELFGVWRDELKGQLIDSFLPRDSRPQLHDLLQAVVQSGVRQSCTVTLDERAVSSGHWQFVGSILPSGPEDVLLACCPCIDSGSASPQ